MQRRGAVLLLEPGELALLARGAQAAAEVAVALGGGRLPTVAGLDSLARALAAMADAEAPPVYALRPASPREAASYARSLARPDPD